MQNIKKYLIAFLFSRNGNDCFSLYFFAKKLFGVVFLKSTSTKLLNLIDWRQCSRENGIKITFVLFGNLVVCAFGGFQPIDYVFELYQDADNCRLKMNRAI